MMILLHPMTPASPYPPYPNLVIFNLSRGTSLRPAPAAHVPCYHAEKLRQQLQAKQQAVQASSTASAEPGEIVLVADVAGFLIWSGNWIWVTIPSRTFQIGELLQLIDSLGLGHCKRLARCWKLSQMVFPDTPRVKTGVPATLHKLPSLQSIAADSCHGALPESQWRVGWKSQRAEVRSNSCWQSCGKECQRWHVSQLSQIPKR